MSESAYYKHRNRLSREKESEHEDEIIRCFDRHQRRYGRMRIKRDLGRKGICVSENKIARILKKHGRIAKGGRKRKHVVKKTAAEYTAENLVKDKSSIKEKNRLWCADISEVKCFRDKLYVSGIIDVGTKKIVGWHVAKHARQEIVQEAIKMAYNRYEPSKGLIFHSDRGCQYTALETKKLLEGFGIKISMSRPGTPSDNQPIESFWKTLKQEIAEDIDKMKAEEASREVIRYMEMYYNGERLHSSIDYQTPNEAWSQ